MITPAGDGMADGIAEGDRNPAALSATARPQTGNICPFVCFRRAKEVDMPVSV